MRKQIFSFLMVAVVTFVSGATVARADLPTAGETYGNAGVVGLVFEGGSAVGSLEDGTPISISVPDVGVVAFFTAIGKQVTDYVAVEFRVGGLGSSGMTHEYEVTVGDIVARPELEIDANSLYGGYLRFGNFVTDSFYPYAIVGFTGLNATFESKSGTFKNADGTDTGVAFPGFKETESETSSSFGFGFIKEFNNGWDFGLEFMKYMSDDDFGDVEGWAFTLDYTY